MSKKPFNPFPLLSYRGKKYFCDREGELSTMLDHLQNDRNIVLYSWRRMGKSALIYRLFDELESGNFECLYVDFLATRSVEEAINTLTQALYEKYGKTKTGISATIQRLFSILGVTVGFNALTGVPEINFKVNSTAVSEHSLSALGQFLSERKKRVVVAIDEFQQVSNYENGHAEAVFRTWVQQFPDIRFIFSGSHRKMMVSMFAEKNRPFYHSAQLLALDPIPFEKYAPFIQGHFEARSKEISLEQIETIYQWARGQTYTIQLICNFLFSHCVKVSDGDIILVLDEILNQHQAMFGSMAKMLTKTQWRLFKAIAKEEPLHSPQSKDFLLKYGLGAASTVGTALKALERLELVVEEDEGGYIVHEVLLSRWMARLV
ncbi:ATP-binding protein [Litoribacter ruber]|uniref:AAA family ATPase n=1 Tax=Litoribacter ruber TaxID=702568 RepID=UPI001BD95CEA|nr:ATP-binding protein [Litoribacter ruber]MBT0812069.1 ATP-binding protein [Litoribacter ruber]